MKLKKKNFDNFIVFGNECECNNNSVIITNLENNDF
jgi:hypothetical protein